MDDAPTTLSFSCYLQKGSSNKSDYMSRHPDTSYSSKSDTSLETLTEHYINFLVDHHVPKHMTVEQIQTATKNDEVLCKVKLAIQTGQWDTTDPAIMPYLKLAGQLTLNSCEDVI